MNTLPSHTVRGSAVSTRLVAIVGICAVLLVVLAVWLGVWRWNGAPAWCDTSPVGLSLVAGASVVIILLAGNCLFALRPLNGRRVAVLVLACTLVKLCVAAAVPVLGDEAYHWQWTHHLDWAYYDHPGAVAWMAWPFSLLGDNMLLVRALPVLTGLLVAIIVGRVVFECTGDRHAGWYATLLAVVLPANTVGGVFLYTDAPLALFWMLGIWFFMRALREDRWWDWILLGLCGAGMLNSKFFSFWFPAGVVLTLLLDRNRRRPAQPVQATDTSCTPKMVRDHERYRSTAKRSHRPLLNGKLYVAAGVALVGWLPTIAWNAGNGWETFLFNFAYRQRTEPRALLDNIDQWGGFMGFQMGNLGILLFLWLIVLGWVEAYRAIRRQYSNELPLIMLGWVPWLLVSGLAMFRPARLNWTAFTTAPMVAWFIVVLYRTVSSRAAGSQPANHGTARGNVPWQEYTTIPRNKPAGPAAGHLRRAGSAAAIVSAIAIIIAYGVSILPLSAMRTVCGWITDSERNQARTLAAARDLPGLGRELDALWLQYNEQHPTHMLADRYHPAAVMSVHTRQAPEVYSAGRYDVYGMAYVGWMQGLDWRGDDVLLVSMQPLHGWEMDQLEEMFESVELLTADPAPPVQACPSPKRQCREKHSSECAHPGRVLTDAFRLACARGSDRHGRSTYALVDCRKCSYPPPRINAATLPRGSYCRIHDYQQYQSTVANLHRRRLCAPDDPQIGWLIFYCRRYRGDYPTPYFDPPAERYIRWEHMLP